MEDLQKSSVDGKRNQIVMITLLKFVSIFLKYLHAWCIHVSLSMKIYQVRVNEPTTFNSGLALCLFLSGLLNTKPFFSSHSFLHHFSQFQQRKSFSTRTHGQHKLSPVLLAGLTGRGLSDETIPLRLAYHVPLPHLVNCPPSMTTCMCQ